MRVTTARARRRLASWACVLAPVLGLSLTSCERGCPKIHQTVVITSVDSELQTLIDPCTARRPAAGEMCAPTTSDPSIDCGCRALCDRVLELIDQFPGPESIEECHYYTGRSDDAGAGAGPEVVITYRPSSCP